VGRKSNSRRALRALSLLFPISAIVCGATSVAAAFSSGSGNARQPAQATGVSSPESAAPQPETPTPLAAVQPSLSDAVVLDARRDGWDHLWINRSDSTELIPLAAGPWNDHHPAISPDGTSLAFASDRDGGWDIYVLDLASGAVRRVTETPAYEGWPTWSPDGLWLAVESYSDGDLDIWVLSIDGSSPPIQLTNERGADLAPAWDPQGRRIAFISDREGEPDLYLADLDATDEGRFRNLSRTATAAERDPAFSPDGLLAFASTEEGVDRLRVLDLQAGGGITEIGQGVAPAWSTDGTRLIATLRAANRNWPVAYLVDQDANVPLLLPATAARHRASWLPNGIPASALLDSTTEGPLVGSGVNSVETASKADLASLPGVRAPNAQLSQRALVPFTQLRERVVAQAGWDLLSRLAFAFVGINDPLPPGWQQTSWLQTGRAFSFAVEPYRAGWIEIVREDIGAETYWRVYLRAAQQDGSAGEPLRSIPWDLDARYRGNAPLYDQGGALKSQIPGGYYVDLTALAADLGFERLAALANWRRYYPGARFNEFVFREGLSWEQAMLELYPPEAITTPTPFRTPTLTPSPTLRPTATPLWRRWRTPTPSPLPTLIPTATPP